MIAGMEIASTQVIGLEDHFTYSVDVSWTMTVDPQAFVTAVVPEDERADIPEDALAVQTQTFEFHQEIRDHNQPAMVTPPPAENVISLLAMFMAGPPSS
jgi:spore coat polysaccharide biosynthesis protein SpsF (cytidylyltransferase family)